MRRLAVCLVIAANLSAQTFEVASIHSAKDDGGHDSDVDKGLFRAHNLTLRRLIALACEVDARQVLGGPNWLDSDGFDITARIPEELVPQQREKFPLMLQALLAARFKPVIHREPRQVSGYALVVSKKGPKMTPSTSDQDSDLTSHNNHLTGKNATMKALARHLSRNREIGELVVDRTGLTGRFNFELIWQPERLEAIKPEPSNDDHPGIFTALQEQLGLRLESAKAPLDAVIVDRAEKPDAN